MKFDLRIRCILFGCGCDENSACPKCGCALYDADFVQEGKLHWFQSVWGNLKSRKAMFTTRQCEVCGKRMWFTWSSPCCSENCRDQWIPF